MVGELLSTTPDLRVRRVLCKAHQWARSRTPEESIVKSQGSPRTPAPLPHDPDPTTQARRVVRLRVLSTSKRGWGRGLLHVTYDQAVRHPGVWTGPMVYLRAEETRGTPSVLGIGWGRRGCLS